MAARKKFSAEFKHEAVTLARSGEQSTRQVAPAPPQLKRPRGAFVRDTNSTETAIGRPSIQTPVCPPSYRILTVGALGVVGTVPLLEDGESL
jgi:hypothetical protein